MDYLLSDLNPDQRRAVTAPAGPLLILAGAGSGKTRTLTHRIAHLLAKGEARPSGIVGLTFTNKAAEEMRQRLNALIGPEAIGVRLSTFHSFGARFLRAHGARLNLPSAFGILDDDDSLALVKEVMKGRDNPAEIKAGDLQSRIERAKADRLSPEDCLARAAGPVEDFAARCYALYEEAKARLGGVDFEDLILLPTRLLTEFPDIKAGVMSEIEHVLVDEYQDTSEAQYRLLQALAGERRSVTCVGDPDQSIYRWRGADIRNILEFEADFADAQVITMEQNYRSTGRILQAASAVIARNLKRKEKKLWTRDRPGPPLAFYQAVDEVDEGRTVAHAISRLTASGTSGRDIAVLYRTHAQSRALEEALASRGIGYAVIGGVKFYTRKEVKDLIAYLRVMANPADSLSLARALVAPPRGVGESSLARLKAAAAASDRPALEVLAQEEFRAKLPPRARTSVAAFLNLLERMARVQAEDGFAAALGIAIEESGYLSWLEGRGAEDAADRRGNLRELAGAARAAEETGLSLADFLERAILLADIDGWRDGEPVTALMTLHNAKGLEFRHVFICGVEEGLLPHASSLADDAELEEERRLFYVGMTRAKESLILTAARGRRTFERFQWGQNSRFLSEVPDSILFAVGSAEQLPLSDDPSSPGAGPAVFHRNEREPDRDFEFEGEPAFRRGEPVRHEQFGTGQVLSLHGSGAQTRVIVHFPGYGRKTFLAHAARLSRIEEP